MMESDTSETQGSPKPTEAESRLVHQVRLLLALKHAKTDNQASEIFPHLYLGSIGAAMSKKNLQEQGITHILTVADNITPRFPDLFVYKCISLLDTSESDLLTILPECFEFVDQACAQGGKVLLHCFAGKSRSASVAIAYVMKSTFVSLLDAFRLVREKRPCAMPNTGFMKQLKIYEERIFNRSE
jgi:protein-tyrosine phosphatase